MLNSRSLGQGIPLIAVHGWGQFGGCFGSLARKMSGVRLISPDLPGHGKSPEDPKGTLRSWSEAFVHWLDQQSLPQFHLMGWSLGGLVLLQSWDQLASRTQSLTLVGSTPRFVAVDDGFPGQPPTQVRALDRQVGRDPETAMLGFQTLMGEGAVLSRPIPSVKTLQDGLRILRDTDLRSVLAAVQCPLFLIHGGQDEIVTPLTVDAMRDWHPQAKTLLIPDAGHTPFLSHQAQVAKALEGFLHEF